MLAQERITIIGADTGEVISYPAGMLTHEQIREELIRQLDAKTISGVRVAKALNLPTSRISEMKARTRRVQPQEMAPLVELLEMTTQYASEVAEIMPQLTEETQKLIWKMTLELSERKKEG